MGLHRAAVGIGGAIEHQPLSLVVVVVVVIVVVVVLILVAVAFYGVIKQLMLNRLRAASGSRAD